MHGEDIHFIVMGSVAVGRYPILEIIIVNNVVASNEARQIEHLGQGIDDHSVLSCPVADHQGGDVLDVGNVRHPHRDGIKAFLRGSRLVASNFVADTLYGDSAGFALPRV